MNRQASFTIGVDVGTYESKGVLVDEHGRVVASAHQPHEMIVPQPGWAEHRPEEDWWGDVVAITRQLLSGVDPTQVKAFACSAIGPCMLPVDANGDPLMNGVLYGVDTRAMAEVEELTGAIGEDVLMARCGNALTSQSVGPKILWLKRHRPDIFARTAKILTSTSFIVQRLTGADVIDHFTAANFAPFYDVTKQEWCFDLAPDIIEPDKLPKLHWSSDIIGQVSEAAAAETGLVVGTPVTTGTIDAAAEALSVGVRDPGDLMMMYGSTIFMVSITSNVIQDARLWYAPWLFPDQHASMAGLATSGTLTHWFRDQFARELARDEAFPALVAEAQGVAPGSDGLLFLPYFSGERTPIHDPHAKGALFGLNLTHTRGHMFRAVIEGIAHGTRHVTETYAEAGIDLSRILAVGGGVKNPLWLQATSDMTGLDQILSEKSVGASFGNAFLARLAIGDVRIDDIEVWNPQRQRVTAEPRPGYAKAHPLWRRLYEQTKDIARELG